VASALMYPLFLESEQAHRKFQGLATLKFIFLRRFIANVSLPHAFDFVRAHRINILKISARTDNLFVGARIRKIYKLCARIINHGQKNLSDV